MAVGNCQVDLELGAAHLGARGVSISVQAVGKLVDHDLLLGLFGCGRSNHAPSALGVFEERLEANHSQSIGAAQVDMLGTQRRKDIHLIARTRHGHVESPLAAHVVERSEVHGNTSLPVGTIPDREQYHVALVALHVFKVLDEYRFGRVICLFLEFGICAELLAEQVFDKVLLHLAERNDTYAQTGKLRVFQPSYHLVDYCLSFDPVAAAVALVVDTLDRNQMHLARAVVDGREGEQTVAVVIGIAESYKALVPASVVPGEVV